MWSNNSPCPFPTSRCFFSSVSGRQCDPNPVTHILVHIICGSFFLHPRAHKHARAHKLCHSNFHAPCSPTCLIYQKHLNRLKRWTQLSYIHGLYTNIRFAYGRSREGLQNKILAKGERQRCLNKKQRRRCRVVEIRLQVGNTMLTIA